MPDFELPPDPGARFRALYDALNRDRTWYRNNAAAYRFTAVAAVTIAGPADEVADRIKATAEEIRLGIRWFDTLKYPLRFIVSAMLNAHGDTAGAFLAEAERVRGLFRERGLRRGGIYETMAILVMRIQGELAPIPDAAIERFQTLYEEMKRHHWWLTGPDDFPACAVLTSQPGPARQIGDDIEAIYQALHAEGFSRGDPLQTAANLLYLARRPPTDAASRYAALARGFRQSGVRIVQSDYDELAILTFLEAAPDQIVARVLEIREDMKALEPEPDPNITFNLAASIGFLEAARAEHLARGLTDAKALLDMQAVIQAQQAALVASTSAATSAAAASS